MAGHGSIFDLGGALMDGNAIDDARLAGVSARTAHEAASPQMPDKLLLENVARLDEEASIDGLVRHTHRSIMRECVPEANGDLARRPITA
jgi:hypothetical protein